MRVRGFRHRSFRSFSRPILVVESNTLRPKKEELARIGGEAAAYYALALWRSVQLEELRKN
jgi:hypothetical protein